MVTVESVAEATPCGPEVEPVVDGVQEYIDARYDRIYLNQIGPDQDGFFRFFTGELLPAPRSIGADVSSS